MEPSLYDHLQLSPSCSKQDIKRQYKALALQSHPDKNANNTEVFFQIQHAYKVLSDDKARYGGIVTNSLV